MNDKLIQLLIVVVMIGGGIVGGIIGHCTIGDEYTRYLNLDTGEEVTMWMPQGSFLYGVFGMILSGFGHMFLVIVYGEMRCRRLEKSNP